MMKRSYGGVVGLCGVLFLALTASAMPVQGRAVANVDLQAEEDAFTMVVRGKPTNLSTPADLWRAIQWFSDNQRYDAAIAEAAKVEGMCARDADASILYKALWFGCDAYIMSGRYDEARGYLKRVLREYGDSVLSRGDRNSPLGVSVQSMVKAKLSEMALRSLDFAAAAAAIDTDPSLSKQIIDTLAGDDKRKAEWNTEVGVHRSVGDMLRMGGDWEGALLRYRQALRNATAAGVPQVSELQSPGWVEFQREMINKELPTLIRECSGEVSDDWVRLRKQVDAKVDLADQLILLHSWSAASKLYLAALRYLQNNALPQGLSEDEKSHYRELKEVKLPKRVNLDLLANVEGPMTVADLFCGSGHWPQAIEIYRKAVDYLSSNPLPSTLDPAQKIRYSDMKSDLGKRIAFCEKKLGAGK